MKSDYIKPVLDLPATGAKIKTLMKMNGMTVRSLQDIFETPYPQAIYNWLAGSTYTKSHSWTYPRPTAP